MKGLPSGIRIRKQAQSSCFDQTRSSILIDIYLLQVKKMCCHESSLACSVRFRTCNFGPSSRGQLGLSSGKQKAMCTLLIVKRTQTQPSKDPVLYKKPSVEPAVILKKRLSQGLNFPVDRTSTCPSKNLHCCYHELTTPRQPINTEI